MTVIPHIFRIAPGWNNLVQLKPLHLWNPPMFRILAADVKTEWEGYITREVSGLGDPRDMGRAVLKLVPLRIDLAEAAYIYNNFVGRCTITYLNKTGNKWKNGNATLFPLDKSKQPEMGYYYGEEWELRFIKELESE